MITEVRVVALLKAALVVLFGILIVFQTVSLPGEFAHKAQQDPEMAYLRWPATIVTVFWVLCVQVVIVALWKLLTLVRRDRIFSTDSITWINVIVWAIGAAWVSLCGVFLFVGFQASDPALPLILLLALAGVSVLGLLMVVMRALLRQATTLRSDMEAVI